MRVSPEPATVRFLPDPVMVEPLTATTLVLLFVQVCEAPSTTLTLRVAVPALLMTACGASVFVVGLSSGVNGLMLAALGLAVAGAGGAGLYALYRIFRGD